MEQVREKNWSSKTIRTKSTKLNEFTEYIQEKTDKEELQQKIVSFSLTLKVIQEEFGKEPTSYLFPLLPP